MMSEKDMENLDEKENFDDDLISTETLHDIHDGNQTHLNIDKREARLKICDRIKQNDVHFTALCGSDGDVSDSDVHPIR